MSVQSGQTSFTCYNCEKSFKKKYNLTQHVKNLVCQKKYVCKTCEMRFTLKKNLISHMVVHSKKKPFKCSYCEASFKNKLYLTRHVKIHTGEANFICDICGKRFPLKCRLDNHMTYHSTEKPYTCTYCGASFKAKSNCSSHIMRKHVGEKNCICNICGKSFLTKSDLEMHTVIHSTERLYVCSYCELSFKRKEDFTQHMKMNTEDRNFISKIDEESFHNKSIIKSRVVSHRQENQQNCNEIAYSSRQNCSIQEQSTQHPSTHVKEINIYGKTGQIENGISPHEKEIFLKNMNEYNQAAHKICSSESISFQAHQSSIFHTHATNSIGRQTSYALPTLSFTDKSSETEARISNKSESNKEHVLPLNIIPNSPEMLNTNASTFTYETVTPNFTENSTTFEDIQTGNPTLYEQITETLPHILPVLEKLGIFDLDQQQNVFENEIQSFPLETD